MDRSVNSVPVQARKVRAEACATAQLLVVRSWPEVAQGKRIQQTFLAFNPITGEINQEMLRIWYH